MSMSGGGDKDAINAEINVTPMADVMLVLLIIFMVITPMLQKGVTVEMAQTDTGGDKYPEGGVVFGVLGERVKSTKKP